MILLQTGLRAYDRQAAAAMLYEGVLQGGSVMLWQCSEDLAVADHGTCIIIDDVQNQRCFNPLHR